MIFDGRKIAEEILAATRAKVATLGRMPIVRAVVVSPTPATESYLKIKSARAKDAGTELEIVRLSDSAITDEVISAVQKAGSDAVIVQLPLPAHIDATRVLDAIPVGQDADVLSRAARTLGTLSPPVVAAVKEILERNRVDLKGKKAVVVGSGWLVGEPVAEWVPRMAARV